MVLSKRIDAFAKLGELMLNFSAETETTFNLALSKAVRRSCAENGWYTDALYHTAIENIGKMLSKQAINQWLEAYKLSEDSSSSKNVAIIMAGNIPLVGFHDFLCVLITGNSVLAKLSHNDKCVLPVLADMLIRLEPEFASKIKFTESKLENFDAVIATGNNNSARYFDYYFKNYPHIIRQNRNSIAVLTGDETDEQLRLLGNDMFQYFGLGCRNVSKLFLPKGLNLERLFVGIDAWRDIANNNKYANNYTYQRAILLMNSDVFFDTGFAIYRERAELATAASVYNYEYYDSMETVKAFIQENTDKLQCVVSNDKSIAGVLDFGQTQMPQLWDYADGVDVIAFLMTE